MIGPDLFSFRALWRQYRRCRRNKRNTLNALAFEVDAEANLLALQQELRAHTYRPGRSICFVTGGPKPREVFAADFRDRIVHHLLVAQQERVFEPLFIHDSFACRRGKGTLAASDRLMAFLRRVTANGRRRAWALKLDVASFFPSIHKATLDAIIARRIRHPELVWLTRTLLFHDPTTNYRFRSRRRGAAAPGSARYPVPAAKSLFGKQNERGLPIGNLTSQFWGNVYLNKLDQFVKRRLRCRDYVRYVDDMILLSTDLGDLVRARAEIETFLRERLGLELRADEGTRSRSDAGSSSSAGRRGGTGGCPGGGRSGTRTRAWTPSSAGPCGPRGAGGRSGSTSGARTSRGSGRSWRRTPATSGTAGPCRTGSARGAGTCGSGRCSRAGAGRWRSGGRGRGSRGRAGSRRSTGSSCAARVSAVSSHTSTRHGVTSYGVPGPLRCGPDPFRDRSPPRRRHAGATSPQRGVGGWACRPTSCSGRARHLTRELPGATFLACDRSVSRSSRTS